MHPAAFPSTKVLQVVLREVSRIDGLQRHDIRARDVALAAIVHDAEQLLDVLRSGQLCCDCVRYVIDDIRIL